MQLLSLVLALAFFLLFAQESLAFIECSVLDYGGVADNSTDLGPALLSAWKNCVIPKATSTATDTLLYVPSGNYLLKSNVLFDDAVNFNLHITGNIYLPFDSSLSGTMIEFENCDNIVLNGPGAIYGNGYRYRPGGNLSLYPNRPRLIRFQNCNNCEITQVTLYDAPMFHVTVIGNNNEVHDMSIHATHIGETDGFDMSGNNNYVHDVSVENGDECVTVKTPTNGFVAERITCKWTAGCNIGSFGDDNTAVDVQNVYYSDVTLSNSDAGVMIKSYPDNVGTVKNITYTGFTLTTVAYPIDIDAFWMGNGEDTGKLSITDVSFSGFTGTGTSTRPAVKLHCNSATPCKDIKFSGISITGTAANTYTNACGSGLSGLSSC
ncbi:pectin lyase-like protein [Punctularia strigosozonata HHB-11173 SS5]|uniref:Pectin lyase-like protein n=1 Tax=Punctularia strigosozonata (strain HHB-11173) TaxID=741275 RepID=R7S5P2_PUNST|nr:pectin lyase-like protein [Punctularia strigosozonata HHB-11173 SS5]EIN04811.1 pectin lyase-like protein [Punctularia strigosozonata HHB-11173 SS5]